MTEVEDQEATIENSNGEDSEEAGKKSMMNAISAYRKIKEGKIELTEKEQILLDKECQIIEVDPVHEPVEIELPGKGKIQMGPPTLTRFEKARIVGARSLQLSLGAPPFIEIPKTARSSLDIAMVELDSKVIPIIIRRVLPNGDFQNIPIDYFI